MNSKELLEKIKNDVIMAKNEKAETILTDNLLKYLEEIEKAPEVITPNQESEKLLLSFAHERNIESCKIENETRMFNAKNLHNGQMMLAKATIVLGQNAQKMAMLINGGACVAVLAFLGNAVNTGGYYNHSLILSLVSFAAGVLLAAMASGFSYLSQYFYLVSGANEMRKQIEILNSNVVKKETKVGSNVRDWYLTIGHIMHVIALLLDVLCYGAFGTGIYLTYLAFIIF